MATYGRVPPPPPVPKVRGLDTPASIYDPPRNLARIPGVQSVPRLEPILSQQFFDSVLAIARSTQAEAGNLNTLDRTRWRIDFDCDNTFKLPSRRIGNVTVELGVAVEALLLQDDEPYATEVHCFYTFMPNGNLTSAGEKPDDAVELPLDPSTDTPINLEVLSCALTELSPCCEGGFDESQTLNRDGNGFTEYADAMLINRVITDEIKADKHEEPLTVYSVMLSSNASVISAPQETGGVPYRKGVLTNADITLRQEGNPRTYTLDQGHLIYTFYPGTTVQPQAQEGRKEIASSDLLRREALSRHILANTLEGAKRKQRSPAQTPAPKRICADEEDNDEERSQQSGPDIHLAGTPATNPATNYAAKTFEDEVDSLSEDSLMAEYEPDQHRSALSSLASSVLSVMT